MSKHLAVTITLLSSCKIQTSGGDLNQELNRVTNDSSHFQWIDLSREDFLKYAERQAEDFDKVPLAADDLLTLRMQFWLDQIDASLRASYPNSLKSTPKPKALIFSSAVPSAYVSLASSCIDLKARFLGPGEPAAEIREDASASEVLIFKRESNMFSAQEGAGTQFPTQELDLAGRAEFLNWMMGIYPNCRIEFLGESVNLSGSCGQGGPESSPGKIYSKICGPQVTTTISVHTALIAKYSEEEVVSALAHELAHYYMAHHLTPTAFYNYTYRLGTESVAVKPPREASLEHLKAELMRLAANRWRPWRQHSAVPGQKFDSFLFRPLDNLSRVLEERTCGIKTSCAHVCSRLRGHYLAMKPMVGEFPFEPLPELALASYYTLEKLSEDCLQTITDSDYYLPQIADSFSSLIGLGDFHELFTAKTSYPSALDAWRQVGSELPEKLKAKDATNSKLFAKAAEERLGFFTSELEADLLALEWIASLGIDPQHFVAFQMKGALSSEQGTLQKSDITPAECERLFKNDWLDSAGRIIFVPLDYPGEGHLGSCYRAFSASREIRGRRLSKSKIDRASAPGPQWNVLSSLAIELSKQN